MNETVLVNFHCHSIFSDGEQPPEVLAANLAAAGVRFAALTDHDSIEGLPRFEDALKKRGVAYLTGVELTTQFNGREAHLLGYGFDPEYPALAATLLSLRQVRETWYGGQDLVTELKRQIERIEDFLQRCALNFRGHDEVLAEIARD